MTGQGRGERLHSISNLSKIKIEGKRQDAN